MWTLITVAVVVALGLIVLSQTAYTVDQTEQAIVTRFGQVRAVNTSPGIYFKTPFVDTVTRYDNRLLRIDAAPVAMLDVEKQGLVIDNYIRYRILPCPPPPVDDFNKCGAVQFLKTLQSESGAQSRLDNIVTSSVRAEIANSKRDQIIGAKINPETGALEPTESRSEILERVLVSVRKTIAEAEQPFGVEIVDVRIKGADFPETVASSIFTRMRAERNRIAAGFRSDGDRQDLEIRAKANKQRDITLAEADRDGNINRGQGEAQAICIFAKALEQDPEFYSFRRSLDAYRTVLNQKTTIVLSSESDLFRFLQSPLPASTPSAPQAPAPTSPTVVGQLAGPAGIPPECLALAPASTPSSATAPTPTSVPFAVPTPAATGTPPKGR